jgi:hypothetical protein
MPASLRIGGYVVAYPPDQPDEMRIAVQRSPTVLFITFNGDLAHSLKDARACLSTSWGRRVLTACLMIGRRCCLEKPGRGHHPGKTIPRSDDSECSGG